MVLWFKGRAAVAMIIRGEADDGKACPKVLIKVVYCSRRGMDDEIGRESILDR